MESKKKILIIDSNIKTIENIINILRTLASGFDISTLYTGGECLNIVNNGNCPSVVILGMNLIDMTGLQLAERIRDYSDVPIILLSDDKDIYMLVKAFDSGVNEYMSFPINQDIFIARLKALIRRSEWDIQYKERVHGQ